MAKFIAFSAFLEKSVGKIIVFIAIQIVVSNIMLNYGIGVKSMFRNSRNHSPCPIRVKLK
jgi:NADH:ubiquinone oxidoreductase subunit K